jgi:hypothetical protein
LAVEGKPGTATADANSSGLETDDEGEDELAAKLPGVDPLKAETYNILNDLIDLQRGGAKSTTASAAK